MFMQDIRRATKKHRKVLLAVVVLLMVGLVGSFATWNSGGRSGTNPGGTDVNGEPTLDQQITSYLSLIATLEEDAYDYSSFLNVAYSYMELGDLYMNKYSDETGKIPELDPPVYDEEGNVVPLAPAQEAARAAREAEYNAAYAAAEIWLDGSRNSAGWAREYYQRALDNAPEGLNDAAIAEIKAGQADACDMQGDVEAAAAFRREANSLRIAASLNNISSLKAAAADYMGYLNVAYAYMELSGLYQGNLSSGDEAEDSKTQDALTASAASAIEYYQKALDNAPEEIVDAAKAEIKLGQAEACYMQTELEKALTYVEEAYSLTPENTQLLMVQASLHSELDRKDKAKELYQKARLLEPEDINIAVTYAEFLFYSDSNDAGIAELKAYRDSLPEGHANIDTADEYINYLQSWADLFANMGDINVTDDDDGHDHEEQEDDPATEQDGIEADGEENDIIEAPEE